MKHTSYTFHLQFKKNIADNSNIPGHTLNAPGCLDNTLKTPHTPVVSNSKFVLRPLTHLLYTVELPGAITEAHLSSFKAF